MTARLIDLILGPPAEKTSLDVRGGVPAATARRLTIVGLAKNVGKTVTLNHLISGAAQRGVRLGLTSTGRDGERRDAITELPKPAIDAPEGSLVATAIDALSEGSAAVEIIGETEFHTPFGPIILGRVREPGSVLLIGPGSSHRISVILDQLESLGAGLCLVDGSLDRLAAAAPGVTGNIILATGAAYSPSMKATVARTAQAIDVFGLPAAEPHPGDQPGQDGGPIIVASSLGRAASIVAALGPKNQSLPKPQTGDPPRRRLLLEGALTTSLVGEILRAGLARDVEVVVQDATRVIVEAGVWRRFRRQGGRVSVLRPIRVLAVTCNPWSPFGPGYPQPDFIDEIHRVSGGLPAFDLVAGLSRPPCDLPPCDQPPCDQPDWCKPQ